MNPEHNFQQYIIAAGVEAAAPQYGTTVGHLKSWMRGEIRLDSAVLSRWINRPAEPPPSALSVARAAARGQPAPVTSSSLATRVLSDPNVRAQLERDGLSAPVPVDTGERPISELLPAEAPLDLELVNVTYEAPAPYEPPGEVPSQSIESFVVDTEGRYSIYPARVQTSVTICMPTIRDFSPQVLFGLVMLIRKYELGFELQSDTLLIRARNMLAERFLNSHAKWSLWLDSDMLIPFGDSDWFEKKSRLNRLTGTQKGFDVIKRLLSHNYPFIGAVYAARTANSQLVIQPDIDPRYAGDRALAEQIRGGTIRGLQNVDWVGFGCALIHRRVFEAVRAAGASSGQRNVDFFGTEGNKGEDVAFCERATAAGFRPKLDCELVLGHVGRMCFGPQHTVAWDGRR